MIQSYFNTFLCNHLVNTYEKQGNIIVAFDFDNTIFDYHNKGISYSEIIDLLKSCSDLKFIMILYTSNSDPDRLSFMKQYCTHYGIKIDLINKDPFKKEFVDEKIYYNILLDDKAGLNEASYTLKQFIDYIKTKNNDGT